ncbi:glycine/betaine ABC transporter substrate-binding protein [Pseudomonas oryzihabitans]|nr:glycine/betaine ABC transporter substrate-binding protein [Pseudomonas psychrotolerans]
MLLRFFCLLGVALFASWASAATEPEDCRVVRFSDTGWTDVQVTTASARYVLSALGYQVEVQRLSVPDTLQALADGDVDVFLGTWMPSMESRIKPYLDSNKIQQVRVNLEGARYTLGVLQNVYDAGVKSFADLSKYADKFDHEIYGLQPGGNGNKRIQNMISQNAYGLGGFKLIESSEAAMLANVKRKELLNQWVVFLAWEPHPMNTQFKIAYLSGGEDVWGPNFGASSVYTSTRKDYARKCPNVGRFLANLYFTIDMENKLSSQVLDEKTNPRRAVRDFLKENGPILDKWLEGVQSVSGAPGLATVKTALAR